MNQQMHFDLEAKPGAPRPGETIEIGWGGDFRMRAVVLGPAEPWHKWVDVDRGTGAVTYGPERPTFRVVADNASEARMGRKQYQEVHAVDCEGKTWQRPGRSKT